MPCESGAEDACTPNAVARSADSAGAKRLECVRFIRFIGAFCPGNDDPRFMVPGESSGRAEVSLMTTNLRVPNQMQKEEKSNCPLHAQHLAVETARFTKQRGPMKKLILLATVLCANLELASAQTVLVVRM